MNELIATTYSGFSNVKGNMSLSDFFNAIVGTRYKHLIEKIERLRRAGKEKEAGYVKRQLNFFTITARYAEKRLPESIAAYNDLITIDIDGLSDEQVVSLRPVIEQEPATIVSFLTAKRHGFKIVAYLVTPETERLRKEYLAAESLPYARLEDYHAKIYEITRRHYETVLGVPVDTSGKDISRGIFASYDPQAFFSPDRLAQVKPVNATLIPAEPAPKRSSGRPITKELPAIPKEIRDIDTLTHYEFNKCVASTQRMMRYEEGSHNPFLFALGNKAFRKGLNEADVKLLAAYRFGDNGKWDTDTPIGNAYTYTSKTEYAEHVKEEKIPLIQQVKNFLDDHYRFRRNLVLLDRLEIQEFSRGDVPDTAFRSMAVKDLNTIFTRLHEAGMFYSLANLKAVIDSDYAPSFNPFEDYFFQLPPWDGEVDYIKQLADTITTTDQPYWHEVFRRWLVGMVACATDDRHINQQVLLLYGKQGKGKSTWIRNLLPPALREYHRNGMLDPSRNDDMLMLANRIIIDMEEFEGVKQNDIAGLKRIVSQDSITLRRVYDIQPRTYPRRASFIGSTNNAQFLNDNSGSRRFLIVHATDINYRAEINYTQLYAQVMKLIGEEFQYWFEGGEIDEINSRNEQHRMKDPLEENLYVYFQPATPKDFEVKWKPAAAILSNLSVMGRTLANAQSQQLLIQILEREKFMKRVNEYGITEYGVVPLTPEQVESNARRIDPALMQHKDIIN